MSALPRKRTFPGGDQYVCFVPIADLAPFIRSLQRRARAKWGVLAARLRHNADVWSRCLEALRPDRLGFVVTDGACDNHVFALFLVCGRGHSVFDHHLQRVDDPQHLVEIAASRHRIHQNELNLFVRTHDEDIAHGLIVGRSSSFG